MNKSAIALQFSVDRMRGKFYMWTFTLPTKVEPRVAARLWAVLQRSLVRLGMSGVRVFEPHPGGHGLHVHLLTTDYFRVEPVRELAIRYGWGRIDAVEIPETAKTYVEKYVTKGKRQKAWSGIRLWAGFGFKNRSDGWRSSRVVDIEHDTETRRIYRNIAVEIEPKTAIDRKRIARVALLAQYGFLAYSITPAAPERVAGTCWGKDGLEPLVVSAGRKELAVRYVCAECV